MENKRQTAYALPTGRIVGVASDVCRGASTITYTLASGQVVLAVRMPGQPLEGK